MAEKVKPKNGKVNGVADKANGVSGSIVFPNFFLASERLVPEFADTRVEIDKVKNCIEIICNGRSVSWTKKGGFENRLVYGNGLSPEDIEIVRNAIRENEKRMDVAEFIRSNPEIFQ